MNGGATRNNNLTQKRNKKWEWKETDLLADMNSLRISALTHAAKIAPLVTHCTLGDTSSNNSSSSSSSSRTIMRTNSFDEKTDDKSNLRINVKNELFKKDHNKRMKNSSKEILSLSSSSSSTSSSSSSEEDVESKDKFRNLKISIENDSLKSRSHSPLVISKSPRKVEVLDYEALNNTLLYKTMEKQRIQRVNQQQKEFIQKIIKEEDQKLKQIYVDSQQNQDEWLTNQIKYEKQLLEEVERKTQLELEKRKKELNELHKKTENQLRMIAIDGILKYQKHFKGYYGRMVKLMKSASMLALPNCEEYNNSLKMLLTMFDQLQQKVKNEIIGPAEVKSAENLCLEIDKLEKNLIKDIENFEKTLNNQIIQSRTKPAVEEQQQQQQKKVNNVVATAGVGSGTVADSSSSSTLNENQLQLENQVASSPMAATIATTTTASESTSTTATIPSVVPNCVSQEQLEFYNNIMKFYTEKVEHVKPLQADDSMKKYRFACQKAINTPVNAISGVNAQHLQDKFDKIFSFISGSPISTTDGSVLSVTDHPLGKDYCLLLLAKKFVGQCDSLISSNAQAAFPIASIIISIWKNIPDFGLLYLAYTFKDSPYLVPYFLPQQKGQSNENFLKSLGYKAVDGVLEKQDMYLKRQAGYMRLYATIMITDSRTADSNIPHPYGLQNGWKWLCNLLNLEPLPDICATLIFEFLQIAGYDMWQLYRNQFSKLLITLQQEYFPKLSKVDEGGPKSRLEVFLQKVLQEGKINKPVGMLPTNFW